MKITEVRYSHFPSLHALFLLLVSTISPSYTNVACIPTLITHTLTNSSKSIILTRIAQLYIYPIKSLAPLSVSRARLRPEGVEHDRRFMLLKVQPDGTYKNIQIVRFPECALFHQRLDLDAGEIEVTYHVPSPPLFTPVAPEQRAALRVPLYPDIKNHHGDDDNNNVIDVSLGGSRTIAYRMGDPYDAWFSACFGYEVVLVYIGDQARDVLAHKPSQHLLWRQSQSQQQQQQEGGWMSAISSYIPGMASGKGDNEGEAGNRKQGKKGSSNKSEWLAFNDVAPYLVTSKASLHDVSKRLPEGEDMDMRRFRSNIVVDGGAAEKGGEEEGEGEVLEAWDEDFWAELTVVTRKNGGNDGGGERHRLALTANCGRCMSINVDYDQGRPSEGEPGQVLKKLMADRRVDLGNKYSPIFGRYAFIAPGERGDDDEDVVVEVAVGDEIHVTKRLDQRDTWAWPRPVKNGS